MNQLESPEAAANTGADVGIRPICYIAAIRWPKPAGRIPEPSAHSRERYIRRCGVPHIEERWDATKLRAEFAGERSQTPVADLEQKARQEEMILPPSLAGSKRCAGRLWTNGHS